MLMIAEDAPPLRLQSTRIGPTPRPPNMLSRIFQIDGTILANPIGTCFAIGVILDGAASAVANRSGGSRYKSAIRYVGGRHTGRTAIVFSNDGTMAIIPFLRPQVEAAQIEAAHRGAQWRGA